MVNSHEVCSNTSSFVSDVSSLFAWVFYLFKASLPKGLSLLFTSKELHCIDLERGFFFNLCFVCSFSDLYYFFYYRRFGFHLSHFFSFWAWWQVFQHFLLFFCASTDSLLVIHPPYFSVGCMCRQVYSSVFLSVFLDSEVRCAVSMSLCSFQSWIFFLPDFQLSCIVVGKDTWFDYSFWKICWDLFCGLSYDLPWGLFHVLIENVHPPTVEQSVLWCRLARCFIDDVFVAESGVWKLYCYCLLISELDIWAIEDLSCFLSNDNS